MTAVLRGVKYIMGGRRFLRASRPYAPALWEGPDGARGIVEDRIIGNLVAGERFAVVAIVLAMTMANWR
jgi:hypothetical protein